VAAAEGDPGVVALSRALSDGVADWGLEMPLGVLRKKRKSCLEKCFAAASRC
jgi:hypothetical protein